MIKLIQLTPIELVPYPSFLVLILCCASLNIYPQNTETVINKYFESIGGIDNWKKIENLIITGDEGYVPNSFMYHAKVNLDEKLRIFYDVKKGLFRKEVTQESSKEVTGFDGEHWWIGVFDKKPIRLSGDLENMFNVDYLKPSLTCEALIFINYQAKGYLIDYVGRYEFKDNKYNVLKVTFAQKELGYYYFNDQTGVLNFRFQNLNNDQTAKYFQYYKKVGDILIAHRTIEKNSENSLMINFLSFEINSSSLTNELFVFD